VTREDEANKDDEDNEDDDIKSRWRRTFKK
jgi:hypothetical protein